VERPQPDGAGFGYTSSIEAIVSSARCVTGDARVISKALQGSFRAAQINADPARTEGPHTNRLMTHGDICVLLRGYVRSFAPLRMTRVDCWNDIAAALRRFTLLDLISSRRYFSFRKGDCR